MVHGKTQYDKIISLTGQLSNSSNTVPRRREIAKELEQQLSNHDVRKRLAIETSIRDRTDGFSTAARRCQALSMLWSNALSRCILMCKEIMNESKAKFTIEDIRLPDKILRASSQPDDAFDSNGLGIPKLSKKSVRSALKFCLEILQNENIPQGGEQIMMDMLAFLCSKDEYMGCFKYAVDFRNVLSEIFYRLTKQEDMVTPMIFESASKAFGNFFCTCSRLGIEFHSFISDSLEILSEWCKINIQRNTVNSSSSSRQYFFNAIANMLGSHPDHSIGPLKRFGRHILRYCKRAYATAQGVHKEALNRYILSHLFVAQVAGKIQGLVDGDLGDLGAASLTERQLVHLLDLGINDVVKIFDKDANTVTDRRKRRQQISNQVSWYPLDDRQQLQLELVSRLLACAQRVFISREGWNALEIPEKSLDALLKVPDRNNSDEWKDPELPETQDIPARVLALCPWMNLVLRKLMLPKNGTTLNDPVAIDKSKDLSGAMSIQNPLHPVLELISNNIDVHESPIPYLAIIGSSAEMFPAGECWTLSAIENWHCLIPEDKHKGEVIWCHGSSAFDLALLLSILSKLLEVHGQPEGDPRIQFWILLILTKLTETTAVLVQNLKDKKGSHHNAVALLVMEWRMIWKTLLRPDLRYTSFRHLGENSLGEMLLILLTEIISQKCTEMLETVNSSAHGSRQSSFIYEEQKHIWGLLLRKPAIFTEVRSRAQFELIVSISIFAGLSDAQSLEENKRPLRQELLHLTLCSFKEVVVKHTQLALQRSKKRELTRSIAYCITCLVNGSCQSMPCVSSTTSRFAIAGYRDFSLSIDHKNTPIHAMKQEDDNDQFLKLLWENKEMLEEIPDLSCLKLHVLEFDSPRLVAKRLRDQLKRERRLEKHTTDFISENDSEKLQGKLISFIDEEIPYHSKEVELSIHSDDSSAVGKESQTAAVKLILSLLIVQKSLETDLLGHMRDIISFFKVSVADLAGSYFEPVEYLQIAHDLQQISQTLIEVVSRHPSTVDLSQQMKISISECQSMLKQYSCQLSETTLSLTSNTPITSMRGESRDGDPDFDNTNMCFSPEPSLGKLNDDNFGTNKRKDSGNYGYNGNNCKRRKTDSIVLAPPNVECAKAVGSLLISMEPSFSNCRLVCERLLGTDIDTDPESIQGDMDLSSVIASANFLGMRDVLLNNPAKQSIPRAGDSEELSPIVMLCQVIDLVRKCAEPSSPFLTYGNYLCAKITVETLKLGLTLTCEEVKLIIGVLSVEDGMRSRPSLRAERIQAATYMFEHGNSELHSQFDKFFTNSIVKAGFDDPNFFLRGLASIAAGAASLKLDEERILNSVSNRIAPIFSSSSAQNTIDMFTDWYIRSGLPSTEEEDISTVEAKDSLEAMESDSLFAKAVLAASIHNMQAFNTLLYKILETAVVRPGLELMCYRALEKVALMRDYSSVQELTDLEAESLLAVWLQKTKDTNTSMDSGIFPLSLTSARSVWYIMLYGRYDYLIQSHFSPEPNNESMDFRNRSAMNFIHRYQGFIIPFTLLKSHNIVSKCLNSDAIIQYFSKDFGFKVVLQITDSSEGDDCDGTFKIFQQHRIDIQTMCILLIHSDDILKKNVGQSILECFREMLSEKKNEWKQKKNVSLLIQRIIQLAGQGRNLYEVMSFSECAYYRAIKHLYLSNTLSEPQNVSRDIFIHAGTSLTELTIYAYSRLLTSKLSNHQHNAWSRFALLGKFLVDQFENGGEQIQLNFFLHVINEIVMRTALQKWVRVQALLLMKTVLRESLCLNQAELDREVAPIINKLIGVCFHVHEESQQNLLHDLRQKLGKHHSVSALELKQSISTSSSAQLNHDCLVGTYDILLWIVQNRESLQLDSHAFVNLSSSFGVEHCDLEILGKVDKRYFAQTLGQVFAKDKNKSTLHQYILGLKYQTKTYRKNNSSHQNSQRFSGKHASIEERLTCAELSQIENILQEIKMDEVSDCDFNCLLSYFCYVCKTSCSQKVRFALSRCIALLEPSALVNVSVLNDGNEAPSVSNDDNLLLRLRAKCIESLGELLKSPKAEVAMAAVKTLEAVLSNDAGRSSCSMVNTTTASLIKPFFSKEHSSRVNATILSKGEIRSLMKFLGTKENERLGDNQDLWCWDERFWTFSDGKLPQFEDWIRHLTSAIIVCCFNPKEEKHFDTECSFFWHCQRIASLDHGFASTVFPLLILALLQREEEHVYEDKNFSGLQELVVNAFKFVLLSWIGPESSINTTQNHELKYKSLSIVIDTLDVLRKVSQGRFLSLKHKPNKKTMKKRKKGEHNVGLDPLIPWQGVSYGVMLKMDGIIVADACMEVQRFASALFFLEMYFNSQYGKSGGLFEELDNAASCEYVIGEFRGVQSIGGVNHMSEIQNSNHGDLKARTLKAMSMTGRCYKELGEIELMRATNMQLSSLNFTDNSDSITVDPDKLRAISSLDTLQVLGFPSQMSEPNSRILSSLTNSMEALGLEGLINTYIEGVFVQNKGLKEMVDTQILREKWFENNLETQNWAMMFGDLSKSRACGSSLVASSRKHSNPGYFELLSDSLSSISNSDTNSSKLLLDQAQSCVIDSLSAIASKRPSPEKFIKVVDKLRALQDVRSLVEGEIDLSKFDFDQMLMLEISSKVRQLTLTHIALKHLERPEVVGVLKNHLWKTCDYVVFRGHPQIAESALSKLKYLLRFPIGSDSPCADKSGEILRIRLEEAKIMECRGDFNGAIQRSKQLIRHIGSQNPNKLQKCLLCDAQILCGSWMTKYKTQQARDILESYLNPAATRAISIFKDDNTIGNAERATRVFIRLGHILANLHDDLLSRIQSKEWEETETRLQQQRQQCLQSKEHRRELKKEFEKLKKNNPRKEVVFNHWKKTETHFVKLEKEYESTNKERSAIKLLVPHYLNHSLKAFLSALEMAGTSSDDLSSHIFRMISLWFSHQNDVTDDTTTNDVMQDGLCKVPSFRFVTLTNQLFSRIDHRGRSEEKFQGSLQNLVFRMCNDHPYHCIAPLVALANGKVVSKVEGVQQIIDVIDKSGTQYVKDLLHSYRILISAYNDLAHASTRKYQGSYQQRRNRIKFSELFPSPTKKSLDRCLSKVPGVPCIITRPPLVRPGKDYGSGKEDPIGGERIAGFKSDFSITESGIHRPKIVMCIGSQGGLFRQLVKGEDDIRQDAIMSQVFTYVNNLMRRRTNSNGSSEDARALKTVTGHTLHKLKMITYNVLPLSPSSGVLEWVEGTVPIIDFLNDRLPSGRIGAHSKYYPGEWSNHQCRFHLENSPLEEKRKSFDEICARHSPSLRFFFLERFGACMESWHIAKMNFTRSVAVSSIVGHILGIGDRHLGNILIDQGSGEVVHIDFGFVFEQGKLLPIPECVPFRLTRNMVDGMGPCGTEGLFVNVAEETISVLRQHAEELLAILSAVVADPLYKWSINPTKALQRQSDEERTAIYDPDDGLNEPSSDRKSQATTKAINKIKEKLQGYEDSTSGEQQGIEGQVQLLINSARDPNNLCNLFPGWGPWI